MVPESISLDRFADRLSTEMHDQGMHLDDLASHSKVSASSIADFLAGDSKPRPREVSQIASALNVPRGWLLREEPLYVARRKVSLAGDYDVDFETELKRKLYAVSQLERENLINGVEVPDFGELREDYDPELVARRVRQHTGLESRPIGNISDLCESLGLLVFVGTFDGAGLFGSMVATDPSEVSPRRLGIALINDSLKVGGERKSRLSGIAKARSSIAHELGHWVVRETYRGFSDHVGAAEEESRLDYFAAHLLLPREYAQRRWNELAPIGLRERAISISAECGTSWSLTLNQLWYFSLISDPEFGALKADVPRSEEFEALGFANSNFQDIPRVPSNYRDIVLDAYENGLLTRERVREALGREYADQAMDRERKIHSNRASY